MSMATPTKCPPGVRQKSPENPSKNRQENSNPNLKSPSPKPSCTKSVSKTHKSAGKTPIKKPNFASPKKKIKERKFVVAKKRNSKNRGLVVNCTCKEKIGGKCLCVAYEILRASQEEFFKRRGVEVEEYGDLFGLNEDKIAVHKLKAGNVFEKDVDGRDNEMGSCEPEETESPKGLVPSAMKRRRDMLLEEARQSVPEPGSGRVLHLVKAFERLLTLPKESDKKDEKDEEDTKKGIKWALPGLQHPRAPETHESSSNFCPGELFFNADSLGLDCQVSYSMDSGRGSVSSRSSIGSRRSSSFSSGTVGGWKGKKKNKQQHEHRVTSQRPFNLRTEQRGKAKEEEFVKKLQEMMIEEEKQRIPVAQGLPWTTDEPECLVKPPVKECTKPIDLTLYSDVRAVERAEFDNQVVEKMSWIEQYKIEREIQQKLEEEEEIRRLRKELVPKAQPMPYFDRPFLPRRSVKQPTIPKEPKFHLPQQKKIKCFVSSNECEENREDHRVNIE